MTTSAEHAERLSGYVADDVLPMDEDYRGGQIRHDRERDGWWAHYGTGGVLCQTHSEARRWLDRRLDDRWPRWTGD